MGIQPPFLYDAVRTDKPFDPKAVSRASLTPKPRRLKQEGPLISFNQHPDSYLIVPYGNTTAKPMSSSIKQWIKWMRILQLVLRIFELLCASGLLVFMILIRGVDVTSGWIMRIVPGIAILHTVYGIYHLARKASGRTPASSASYMMFSSLFDVSIIPFFTFSALLAKTRQQGWTTVLSDQGLMPTFIMIIFYLAAVGAGLHVFSLAISIYLAVIFRKITRMPPDMNPLEGHLTSRHHKRNKSSVSTATTISSNQISGPLESKRASGAAYEDLSRPPTIPFFHTRTQSTDSFSTYKSTPPPSRDARMDLPSRQYGIKSGNSSRASVSDLKRSSIYNSPSPRRQQGSYSEVPLNEPNAKLSPNNIGDMNDAWFTADSLSGTRSRNSSPKRTSKRRDYQPVNQLNDSSDDISSFHSAHPNPLEAHPPTPRHSRFPASSTSQSNSPLSEISTNRRTSGVDIADMSSQRQEREKTLGSSPVKDGFKARYYGELKPGTPPIMIGGQSSRQLSSGNDYGRYGGPAAGKRDVSGKIAEEGRSGNGNGWGARFRKGSGV